MPRSALSELRSLLTIALPLVLAQLAQNGMSFVDTVMVGRLGAGPLAGLALGAMAFNFVYLFTQAQVMAVSPVVAQAVGGGRTAEAARALRHGVVLALCLSVPLVAVVLSLPSLLPLLGQDVEVVSQSAEYLRAVVWGVPAALCYVAMRGFLEGNGRTRPIMFIAFLGVLVNVGLNEVLIFGHLGFPALGLAGAGYATAVTYTLMALAGLLVVAMGYGHLGVFRGWRVEGPVVRELLALGWPMSLTLSFETGLFSLAALVMGYFGEGPLAGHQVAMQTASMSFMVPLGVGVATSVRVGQAVGRGDPEGVRRAGWAGIVVAGSFMCLTAMLYILAPRLVASIYLDVNDPANAVVVGFATTFLALAGAFQLFDGVQAAAVGALRGMKDTRVPMFFTLVSYWLVGMPIGLLSAFVLDLGPSGMWYGLIIGLVAAAVLLTLRFRSRSARLLAAAARRA